MIHCDFCTIISCPTKSIEHCPVRMFYHLFGSKRASSIVLCLDTPLRFGGLKKRFAKCSEKMLIQTLNQLTETGYISKTTVPGKVTQTWYARTKQGEAVLGLLKKIYQEGLLIEGSLTPSTNIASPIQITE